MKVNEMIHTFQINGLLLHTGDVLCTTIGGPGTLPDELWQLVGRLVPGAVDHVAVYVGPGGRCVEAGPLGVIVYTVPGDAWDAEKMAAQRGLILDQFVGIACPVEGRDLAVDAQTRIRQAVAVYCLAQVGKPYNLNFMDIETEAAFYCSQLVYRAYLHSGIDLNTGRSIEALPGMERIVYPQEIWSGCRHRQAVPALAL
jgi:hypothetical protein